LRLRGVFTLLSGDKDHRHPAEARRTWNNGGWAPQRKRFLESFGPRVV